MRWASLKMVQLWGLTFVLRFDDQQKYCINSVLNHLFCLNHKSLMNM